YEYFNQGNSYEAEIFYAKAQQKLNWPNVPDIIRHEFDDWKSKLYSLERLTRYINEELEELIFHGHKNVQLIFKDHREIQISDFETKEEFQHLLTYLAISNKESWNYKNPFVSFNLNTKKGHMRCTLTHYNLSSENVSKLFIRTKAKSEVSLDDFINDNHELSNLFQYIIKEKKNAIISGATGSGKTTLLNLLLKQSPENEHLLILEDTKELQISHRTTTGLLANEQNSLNDLLKYSLRMRPDRIALGEMRSNEIIPFILAMNTGHGGMISTVHANNALETIDRLCLLFEFHHQKEGLKYETIQKIICQSLEYVIFVKDKKCCQIVKIISSGADGPVYETIYQASSMSQRYSELNQSLTLLA
ncbi:MAG: Flp pilus assembly complex ATPase component, partial [Oligoflexia bacterium]|nr:Flp pilus assembly complex ATPase component [Oligoflexia bacterium]